MNSNYELGHRLLLHASLLYSCKTYHGEERGGGSSGANGLSPWEPVAGEIGWTALTEHSTGLIANNDSS